MAAQKEILVVDDEQHIVRLIEVNLVRAGYAVVKAYDAAEAVRTAVSERPDLIVLDDTIPPVDGRDAHELLRADPQTKSIPVVMLSAKGDIPEWLRGRPSGVSAYLTKPFKPRDLVMRVRGILGVPSAASDGVPRLAKLPVPSKLLALVYRILHALFGRGR